MNVEEEIENLLVGGEIVDVVQAQPVILLLVPETSLVVGPTSEMSTVHHTLCITYMKDTVCPTNQAFILPCLIWDSELPTVLLL